MHSPPTALPLPVRSAADALHVLSLAIERPLCCETHAFLLDASGVGGLLVVVAGTEQAEAVLDVVEVMATAGGRVPGLRSLVVATVRPNGQVEATDAALWREARRRAASHGIDLLEWFVVGPLGIGTPRSLAGDAERWPGGG